MTSPNKKKLRGRGFLRVFNTPGMNFRYDGVVLMGLISKLRRFKTDDCRLPEKF